MLVDFKNLMGIATSKEKKHRVPNYDANKLEQQAGEYIYLPYYIAVHSVNIKLNSITLICLLKPSINILQYKQRTGSMFHIFFSYYR